MRKVREKMNQFHRQQQQFLTLAIVACLFLLATAFVDADRQKAGRRIESGGNNNNKGFQSPCGTADQVSQRVGRCLDEIFDLIDGRFKSADSDKDLMEHCDKFNRTERCIRLVAKDCLSGVHKSATSAVASATKRFHKGECKSPQSRARYAEPLRCAIRKGKDMENLYKRYTAIMQGIRDIPDITPEEKLIKMCCALNGLDKDTEVHFNRECPKSAPLVMGIVRAMTEDARTTLCVNPKCAHALDAVSKTPYKPPQNFIEPVAQILYMLNTN